jgi:hypothetical protein
MDIRLKCERPGDIAYTMTITMSAEHWDKLRGQLDQVKDAWSSYPACDLREHITDLLAQARKIYYPPA